MERCKSVTTGAKFHRVCIRNGDLFMSFFLDRSESINFHLLELALNSDKESYTEQTLTNSQPASTSIDETIEQNPKSIRETITF